MAETVCAVLGVDPADEGNPELEAYFKGLNAAFPRSIVTDEVRRLLENHRTVLGGMSAEFGQAILTDWRVAEQQGFATGLPQRYQGGLLFGQLKPRFDNRIIPTCRISGEKTPSKHSRDFYRYRWAMFANNLTVETDGSDGVRKLTGRERQRLTEILKASGYFTKSTLRKALEKELGLSPANLEATLLMPEMEQALTFDPALREVSGTRLGKIWKTIPENWRRIFLNQLFHERNFRGSPPSLRQWRDRMRACEADTSGFEEAVDKAFQAEFKQLEKKGRHVGFNADEFIDRPIVLNSKASGRAPYSRAKLREATECVMRGEEPRAIGGPLEETEEVRRRAIEQPVDEASNNHLVRHRMKIFRRLLDDLCKTYCEGDARRIESVTVEVVRDLVEFSGKTAKEKNQILSAKLSHHRKAVKCLEKAREDAGESWRITAGLIKKARIADELEWTCPYTGKLYSVSDIVHKRVDKEHIVPRSHRLTDALDALVLTFPDINKWKGARTAWQFVRDEQESERIVTLSRFEEFVRKLKKKGPSEDDERRCRRRKAALLTKEYVADTRKTERGNEEEGISGFTEGALSQTSYLNKLAAFEVRKWASEAGNDGVAAPKIVHLSGSVTAGARRAWKLEKTLEEARPFVRDKTKTEMRELTHLHHAVDAVVIALASHYFPRDGRVWRLLSRRRIARSDDRAFMKTMLGDVVSFGLDGSWQIAELQPEVRESVVSALHEKRAVRHNPRTMRGLRVQQNTWRVLGPVENDPERQHIRMRQRDASGKREVKFTTERDEKLLGTAPNCAEGKLASIQGALKVEDNFGVALDPDIRVITHQRVWEQLRELKRQNNGHSVRVIRNGDLIEVETGKYAGQWRVISIKDAQAGYFLDIGEADVVKARNKVDESKINVRLTTLLKHGLCVLHRNYAGETRR